MRFHQTPSVMWIKQFDSFFLSFLLQFQFMNTYRYDYSLNMQMLSVNVPDSEGVSMALACKVAAGLWHQFQKLEAARCRRT